jgi:hypothetical protein
MSQNPDGFIARAPMADLERPVQMLDQAGSECLRCFNMEIDFIYNSASPASGSSSNLKRRQFELTMAHSTRPHEIQRSPGF